MLEAGRVERIDVRTDGEVEGGEVHLRVATAEHTEGDVEQDGSAAGAAEGDEYAEGPLADRLCAP